MLSEPAGKRGLTGAGFHVHKLKERIDEKHLVRKTKTGTNVIFRLNETIRPLNFQNFFRRLFRAF